MSNRSHYGSTRALAGPPSERGVYPQNNSASSSRAAILLAVLLVFFQGAQATAQPVCKPVPTVRDVAFSETINLRRFWTAVVHVDASKCATVSGLFALGFVRLAENGLDLEFAEPFFWRPGPTSVRVEFWADEAVHNYWIDEVATCPCRAN